MTCCLCAIQVTLSVSPSWVDVGGTGGKTSISVAARPNSIIGITAVDKKSLQLRGAQYRLDKVSRRIIINRKTQKKSKSMFVAIRHVIMTFTEANN